MQELPNDRRIMALDLPGAGYSERPLKADVSFAGLANVVAKAIFVLGLHKPVLLGHSHGGAVVLRLGASHPDLVSALVLLCPAHPFSNHEDLLVRFYLSSVGRVFARCLPLLPRQALMFAFKRMPGSRASFGYDELGPYLHTLRTPDTVPHLLRLLGSWHSDMSQLGRELVDQPLSVPTLLLWGDRDIIVPLSTASGLTQHLANAKLLPLLGVGHLPNEEAPAECARAITEWLAEL